MPKKRNKGSQRQAARAALKRRILKVFSHHPEGALSAEQLSAELDKTDKRSAITQALGELTAEDHLVTTQAGSYHLKEGQDYIVGTVDMTTSGAAYIITPELEQDVYVSQRNTGHALGGDTVRVQLHKRGRNKKIEGTIVEVIKRGRDTFVGVFQLKSGRDYGFVVVENRAIHVDIYVSKSACNGARDSEKVVVSITRWPDEAERPFGKIIQILGACGEHEVEMHAILAEYGLPYRFPEEVRREAETLPIAITAEEVAKRRDMRAVPTFTIDPADAKDFDDALSFQRLANGHYEIGIHIADVSHYVQEGSLLDAEAYRRGTSVYLVDRVVPMLPEILSNQVCSLRPQEEKLCFSAIFEISPDARRIGEWFGRTVIRSDHRFTYEQAQEVIESGQGPFADEIRTLNDIAKTLCATRKRKGALQFDKKEVKFKLDEQGEPLAVYLKETREAHHLIEEFMLLANRRVASFVGEKQHGQPSGKTFIYRVHEDPNPEKIEALKKFVKQFGYQLENTSRLALSQSMNEMLRQAKDKPEANMIETLSMRTMNKAKYDTDHTDGHYGLAFDYYTHFTSPIRRYPDVMAHRLLQHYLEGRPSPPATAYQTQCAHASQREKLAVDAERDSVKFMQVKFMEKHLDECFDGIISGVTEWGIYVELPNCLAEGLIRLHSMKDDRYTYDPRNYSIQGTRSKKVFQLGDPVRVRIAHADLTRKQLDFEMVNDNTSYR